MTISGKTLYGLVFGLSMRDMQKAFELKFIQHARGDVQIQFNEHEI